MSYKLTLRLGKPEKCSASQATRNGRFLCPPTRHRGGTAAPTKAAPPPGNFPFGSGRSTAIPRFNRARAHRGGTAAPTKAAPPPGNFPCGSGRSTAIPRFNRARAHRGGTAAPIKAASPPGSSPCGSGRLLCPPGATANRPKGDLASADRESGDRKSAALGAQRCPIVTSHACCSSGGSTAKPPCCRL